MSSTETTDARALAEAITEILRPFMDPKHPTEHAKAAGRMAADLGDPERALGIRNDGQKPNLEGMILNAATTTTAGASLTDIARAVAAREYARLVNRAVGHAAGYLQPGLLPSGFMSEIVHEVDPKGVAVTTVHYPDRLTPISVFAVMDAKTRAVIIRQAQGP